MIITPCLNPLHTYRTRASIYSASFDGDTSKRANFSAVVICSILFCAFHIINGDSRFEAFLPSWNHIFRFQAFFQRESNFLYSVARRPFCGNNWKESNSSASFLRFDPGMAFRLSWIPTRAPVIVILRSFFFINLFNWLNIILAIWQKLRSRLPNNRLRSWLAQWFKILKLHYSFLSARFKKIV